MAVRDHMQKDLVVAKPDTSLVDLSHLLDRRRVGAALVVDDGNLAGIVTERDVVHAVALGADLETSPASDFMSRMLTTIGPDEEMGVAAEVMTRQRIRHLPIVDDGRLVGVLSLRDIARWSLRELGYEEGHHLIQLADLSA